MSLIIERVLASFLLFTGLSYVVHSLIWKDLVQELIKKPTWVMLWSLLFLPFGLIVVFGHNLWAISLPLIITVVGWWVTVKCVLNLLFPNWFNFVNQWSDEFLQRYIRMAGVIDVTLGAILLFFTLRPTL